MNEWTTIQPGFSNELHPTLLNRLTSTALLAWLLSFRPFVTACICCLHLFPIWSWSFTSVSCALSLRATRHITEGIDRLPEIWLGDSGDWVNLSIISKQMKWARTMRGAFGGVIWLYSWNSYIGISWIKPFYLHQKVIHPNFNEPDFSE